MTSASPLRARLQELYGTVPPKVSGVLHVMAVAHQGDSHAVIKIGPHAPKSPTDWLALTVARARVDAIVISGSILRAEPELRYDPPSPQMRSLWPRERDPWLCVLTRGGPLPAAHPVWQSAVRPMVLTGLDAELALPDHVRVERVVAPSPRGAIGLLRDELGATGISIEAGPRVAVPLYDDPLAIDELMLSVFGGDLDPKARGGDFLDERTLASRMERIGGPTLVEETSGPWRFSRYRSRGYRARRGTAEGSR